MRPPPNDCAPICRRHSTAAWHESAGSTATASQCVFPGTRQPHRTVDDAHHAVSLRIVAPHLPALRSQNPRHETDPIAAPEHLLEQLARLGALTGIPQRIDVPESADAERDLRHAEIIALGVARQECTA